jgi:dihydroorotate dehydrogenase
MRLQGIDFGCVFDHSGVRNFFGDGYWYHKPLHRFGLQFEGSTFVAKTTTLLPREGNLLMAEDGTTPKELLPRCIVVKSLRGVVLNAVGLSGPGASFLLKTGKWYDQSRPFMLSFMAVGKSPQERIAEVTEFVDLLKRYLPFHAPLGLQINLSCPNVGLHPANLALEARAMLRTASRLGVPLVPKFNVLLPVEIACDIARHPACDAICVSNTIPWGQLADRIDWEGLFGSKESPLKQFGGGGLSGKPLLPLVCKWVREAKRARIMKPIIAGGGILGPTGVNRLFEVGADAVALSSIAILRPWRVRGTIRRAQELYRPCWD